MHNNELKTMIFARYGTALLNKKQLCEILNVSDSKMSKLMMEKEMNKNLIPRYKKIGGRYFFPIDGVIEFIEAS